MGTVTIPVTDLAGHLTNAVLTVTVTGDDLIRSWFTGSNTGCLAGVARTDVGGVLATAAAGQTISNKTCTQISVNHPNCTFTNIRATMGILLAADPSKFYNCDVGPDSGKGTGPLGQGITVYSSGGAREAWFYNSRVHNCNDLLRVAQIHARDSWFYIPADVGLGSHSDVSQQTGGQVTEVCDFYHCLLENVGSSGTTSDSRNSIFEYPFDGLLDVRHSILNGGAQSVHIGSGRRLRMNDVIITPLSGGTHYSNSGAGVVEEWVNVRRANGTLYPAP